MALDLRRQQQIRPGRELPGVFPACYGAISRARQISHGGDAAELVDDRSRRAILGVASGHAPNLFDRIWKCKGEMILLLILRPVEIEIILIDRLAFRNYFD